MKISLDQKSEYLLAKFSHVGDKVLYSAAKKASISAVRKLKSHASKIIRENKNIKQRDIKKRGYVTDSSYFGSDINSMSFRVTIDGAPIPVSRFSPKQNKEGVKFKANKGEWSYLKGAFIATVRSNGGSHVGVFYRHKKGTTYRVPYEDRKGSKELPIREKFTSGPSSALETQEAKSRLAKIGSDEYEKTFIRIINARLP